MDSGMPRNAPACKCACVQAVVGERLCLPTDRQLSWTVPQTDPESPVRNVSACLQVWGKGSGGLKSNALK